MAFGLVIVTKLLISLDLVTPHYHLPLVLASRSRCEGWGAPALPLMLLPISLSQHCYLHMDTFLSLRQSPGLTSARPAKAYRWAQACPLKRLPNGLRRSSDSPLGGAQGRDR